MTGCFLHTVCYWHWIGLAAIALIIEILLGSSGFLLWISITAILVACLLFLFPSITMASQLIIFAIFSIISVLSWRLYLKYHPTIKTDKPTLNRRAEQYIGRIVTLQAPIIDGLGIIHVDGIMWQVRCAKDLLVGVRIRIVGVDGVILLVEPLP